jgi:hypothetical protein
MSKARDVADSYTDVEVDAKDATLQTQVNDRYTKAETDAAVAKLLRSDANDTHSGVITFTADGGGIAFSRNTDGAGVRFYNDSDSDTNSALNFHIADNGNEDFTWTGKSGPTTTELMRISPDGGQTGFKFRGNTVWHAGNDGAGSGLDADKLDGLDSSSFAQTAKITDSSVLDNVNLQPGFYNVEIKDLIPGYTADHYFVQHLGQWSGGGYSIQVAYPYTSGSTNYYFIRKANNTTWGYWAKCITEVSDGSGSGLDADTVDGVQASSFLRADANSNRVLATNSNSSSYSASAIELREYNKAGVQTGAWSEAPRISFHWSGRNASSIAMATDGDVCIMDNPGTGYEHLRMMDCKVYGTVIESSDARLKENVRPITNALDKVTSLQGVHYNKIESPDNEEIGFVAQEVEEVVPELVTTDETEDAMKAVSYGRTVALLVEAMKEQQVTIESLEKRLLDLESR